MRRELSEACGGASALALALLLCAAFGVAGAKAQKKAAAQAPTDVKIRSRMSSGGGDKGMEMSTYIKGARMRTEMAGAGMGMTNIRQCDLKRTIMINDKTRTYLVVNDGEKVAWGAGAAEGDGGGAPGAAPPPNAPPPTQPRRGGVVNVTNTVTDTGERKEMFGFTARRIKTSTVKEASPDACNKGSHKSESDGWYIDFQYDFSCPGERKVDPASPVKVQPDCEDEVRAKTVGAAKLGYPVLVTTTVYQEGGKTSAMTQEVLELSRAPLDPALFDVPAGYALAKNYQELYGAGVTASAAGGGRTNSSTTGGSSVAGISSVPGAAAAGFVAANAPKKAGAVRIGIVTPKAQLTAGDAAQAAEAVRNTFASYLGGPTVEVVALAARLPSQALEEAKQSQCDYVLYASLTQKKGGGGGGMFGRALGNIAGAAAGHIPVNTAGDAAARSAAVTGIYTTANIAGSVKAKDELTLEYKLEATDGARPSVANTAKAKAKSDGEDVLTPLIEKAAEAIVGVATKK